MDPVLTLSPSHHHHSTGESLGNCSPQTANGSLSPQTTPKLPRRERLASFSRLIASENFVDLLPRKTANGGCRRRISFKGRNFNMETLPTIHVSPGSPKKTLKTRKIDAAFLQAAGKGCLDSPQMPFSPRLLSKPATHLSPSFQYPTPTKSPLYKLDRKNGFLGRGSFGNVTLCVYKDSKFAMKVTRQDSGQVGEKNFLKIRHPHLVAILHISYVAGKTLIFMEFAGHCNLQQVLDTKSELDFQRRISFCMQVLSGLRHCHRQRIVHADVKPANVIVSPYGVCKLGDFGHSFCLESTASKTPALTPEDVVGTAAYAAPEVLRGARPSYSSDVYSFGILLWQVQSREIPFAGEHPHVIIYKVAHYGARPSFGEVNDPIVGKYAGVAKLCWHDEPKERLDSSRALKMLQEIVQRIKQV